jgi:hypothetical protein
MTIHTKESGSLYCNPAATKNKIPKRTAKALKKMFMNRYVYFNKT